MNDIRCFEPDTQQDNPKKGKKVHEVNSELEISTNALEKQLQAETSEHLQTKQKLNQKISEFSAILQALPDTYLLLSFDGTILDYKPGKIQNLSNFSEVVIGSEIWEYLPPLLRTKFQDAVTQVLQTQSLVSLEYTLARQELVAKLLPLPRQEIAILISDRTSSIPTIFGESDTKFRNIIENTNNIVFTLTLEGVFSYVSPNWTDLLGHEIWEVEGQYFVPFIHPDDVQICTDYFTKILTTGEKQSAIEYRVKHKNGSLQWHTSNASPMKDANGKILYFVGICHHTTDRKLAEEALRQSEARFRHLVETTNDGVWEVDKHGVYTYVSPKIRNILGCEPEELLGKTFFDLMPPAEANRVRKIFVAIAQSQQPLVNLENKNFHKNGHLVVLETNGVPFFDVSGNYLGYRGVYRDITERKQAEEGLQALVAGTASVTGKEFFPVLVKYLAAALEVRYALIAERVEENPSQARVLAFWTGDKLGENFEYNLNNTPCDVVIREGVTYYPFGVQQLFPLDPDLVTMQAESYLGNSLIDSLGRAIGHIAVLDTKPILQEQRAKAIISIFAARASTEIVRQRTETSLRKSEAKFRAIAQREALLNRLSSQIRASLELNSILETALQEIRVLFQIDRCAFFWYEQNADLPHWESLHEARNPSFSSLVTQPTDTEVELIAATTLNRQIICIDDVETEPNLLIRKFLHDFGFTAFISLPVHTQSGEMGVLICGYCSGFRPWLDSEVELLRAVTDQLAIAIDQAKLYTQSRVTAQLAEEKAQQLAAALLELQQTQAQLIQTEKMSSLGQLVAGIAHEINNPVNFIYGNLNHASEYVRDLLHLVELYQQHIPPTPEIQKQIYAIDLDFINQDLPKVLDSMNIGAERIRQLVLSLRNFSRLDEDGMKPVDIHEGMDSTLLLLQNRLKGKPSHPNIQVIKEYGNLPRVLCHAGQINQVFMNLLTNAIDALEEIAIPNPQIHIRTLHRGDCITIHIADNGTGITEESRNRLFDPFFTTKSVGKGTGMGLSISYQIIVKTHKGQLECISAPGKGAEFIISIPFKDV